MMEMAFLDHEQMRILILDTKNQVVENISRYQGTVNSSVLRAAEIYRPAILRNCPAVIICHNHPSGDPTPSQEDIAVTEQLVAAGQHLDIELVDHLVIGNQRFVSLKELSVAFSNISGQTAYTNSAHFERGISSSTRKDQFAGSIGGIDSFLCQPFRCIAQCGTYINAHPTCYLTNQNIYGDTCTLYHRLAKSNGWVNDYARK
jgi:hypothetical protein